MALMNIWRKSKDFEEYMKARGVGLALWKMDAMAKPDCVVTSDSKSLTIKTESTLKTQFSWKLEEKFEETTAVGRKTQIVFNWQCIMNNVTCTRIMKRYFYDTFFFYDTFLFLWYLFLWYLKVQHHFREELAC